MAILLRGKPVPVKGLPPSIAQERAELRKAAARMLEAVPVVDPFDASLLPDGAVTLANQPDSISPIYAGLPVDRKQELVIQWGECVDVWLDDMVTLITERLFLDAKLALPELQDHPHRPVAVNRRDWLNDELRSTAEMVSEFEAAADRCWTAMSVEEREPVAHAWLVHPETGRLAGRAWLDNAQFGRTWPTGAYVDGRWFVNLHNVLYLDIAHLWNHGPTWLGEPVEMPPDDQSHLDGWHARLMSG